MPKFTIKMHGKHYKIEIIEKRFFFKRSSWKNAGFYTTRFIESESANEAINKAFKIIESEIQKFAQLTDNSELELDEIQEDEITYDTSAPGGGFTFYLEDQ